MDQNYITPAEMQGIIDYCKALNPLWDALTNAPKCGVSIEQGENISLRVYDSNGEVLGVIQWADDGAAFYPQVTKDE